VHNTLMPWPKYPIFSVISFAMSWMQDWTTETLEILLSDGCNRKLSRHLFQFLYKILHPQLSHTACWEPKSKDGVLGFLVYLSPRVFGESLLTGW
jgi:hypothetical protein